MLGGVLHIPTIVDNNKENMMPPPPKWTVGEGGRRGVGGTSRGVRLLQVVGCYVGLVGTLEKIVEVGPIYAAAGICLCCD